MTKMREDWQQGFRPLGSFTNETTEDEVKRVYKDLANSYDQHAKTAGCVSLYTAISEFCTALTERGMDQESRILDVGAGTGMAGKTLRSLGYKNVDGLDISQEMLNVAKENNTYNNYICAGLGLGLTEVKSLLYDGAIGSACFTWGHMKADALREVAMIVRKGGIITFNSRQDVIDDDSSGYAKTIKELEDNKTWKVVIKKKIIYYLNSLYNDDRSRYCYLFVIEKL